MEFDKDKKLKELLSEFKKQDQFIETFRQEFKTNIYDLIDKYYPGINQDNELEILILRYATELISLTESVIDKDLHYPEYKKTDELSRMDHLILKTDNIDLSESFIDDTHNMAKRQIVAYYPELTELSSIGFLLLERYTKMVNVGFTFSFHELYTKKK